MPDITMCRTSNCKKKRSCYRYCAVPDTYQSYSDFADDCQKNQYMNYWEIKRQYDNLGYHTMNP